MAPQTIHPEDGQHEPEPAGGPEESGETGSDAEQKPSELPDLGESRAFALRARDGDQAALAALLGRYQERLERIVRVELGAELGRFFEPGDVLQEVFLVAQRRVGDFEFRSHGGFLAWLVTIAKRKVKDKREEMHAGKRDIGLDVPLNMPAQNSASSCLRPLAQSTTGPVTHAWRSEIRDLMDRTLSTLPEDYRQVILKRDYYGATWEEIEVELGRGKHACEQLHQRAWIRLKLEVMKKMRA